MTKFSWPEPPQQVAFPVAKAGYSFISGAAFCTAIFALLGLVTPALIGLAATFAVCLFFRDPDRVIPRAARALVSPADGKVIAVQTVDDTPFYSGSCRKVSIFMTVFNVHVNRIPHEGSIDKVEYFPGTFFSAHLDKASKDNEHNAVHIRTSDGRHLCMVQIAGLIARRILCHVQAGDPVVRGQRMGMICFGSRVDLYLPMDTQIRVSAGTKVKAGATVLGLLADSQTPDRRQPDSLSPTA
jgi:phosphatidylserine decarboxylase